MKEVEYYSQFVFSVPDSIEILTLCTKTLKSIMLQLQVVSKNWKQTKENESTDFLSISELLSQRKLCNINIYACIGKMVLGSSLTSPLKANLSIIDKLSFKEHNDTVRDLVAPGCKLCGSPLYHK
jgi:hypothetical protein